MDQDLAALVVKLLFDDSQFRSGVKKTQSSMQSLGTTLGNVAGTINRSVTRAFTAGAASITAFAAASTAVGASFERQIDTVAAISGATSAEIEQLTAAARGLARETEFTASQTGEALQVIAQAGIDANESIALLPTTLDFAQAQSADLASSTELLISTTNQFAASEITAAQASDVFTRATQTTQLNFARLSESLKFAGPQAAAFGVSLEETVAVLGAFADVGIKGSLAGTTFRQALAQAGKQTDEQAAVLQDLGLTFDDINPKTQGFVGILENIGAAGIEADQAIALFGTRAGPALANVAQSAAVANGEIRDQIGVLEESAGATAEQVEIVTDNVIGASREAISQFQDVLIETYETFRGPLQQALEQLPALFSEVRESISDVSGEITNTLQVAATRFGKVLARDGASAADAFAASLVFAANTVSVTVSALDALAEVLRAVVGTLDLVVQLFSFGFLNLGDVADDLLALTAIVAGLTSALGALAGVIGAGGATAGAVGVGGGGLAAVTTSFGAAVAALGGPISAAVIAIGALTLGYIQYRVAIAEAAEEQEGFERAQERLAASQLAVTDELVGTDDVAGLWTTTMEGLTRRQLEVAQAGEQLTGALEEEAKAIEALGNLDVEDVGKKIASGELIRVVTETGEQLRTIDGIVEDLDPAGFEAIERQARLLRDQAEAINEELDGVKQRFAEAKKIARSDGERFAVFEFVTEEQTAEFIRQREKQAAAAIETAEKIEKTQQKAIDRTLQKTARNEAQLTEIAKREAGRRALLTKKELEERLAEFEAFFARLQEISEAEEESQLALLPEAEQIRAEGAVLLREIDDTLEQARLLAAENEEQIARLEEEAGRARALVQQRIARQLAELEQSAGQRRVDLARERERDVDRIVGGAVSRETELRRRAAEDIARIEALAAEEQLALRDELSAALGAAPSEDVAAERAAAEKIRAIDEELADQRVAIRTALSVDLAALAVEGAAEQAGPAVEAAIDAADKAQITLSQSIADGLAKIKSAAGAVLQVVGSVGDAMREIGDRVVRFADQISGGLLTGFDPFAIVGEIAGEVTRAADRLEDVEERFRAGDATREDVEEARERLAEAQRGLASGETARQFVDELVDGALLFVEAIATGLDDILIRFADALPDVLRAIADAIPVILRAIAEALPDIFSALAEAIPEILQAIAENLGPIVEALIRGASEAIQAIAAQLPEIVGALLEAIPGIITAIAEELPEVLAALVGSIGPVVEAIADALPDILVSLAEAIPQLLTVILDLIPTLLIESFRAFNTIKKAILDAVPDVILALIEELPELIAEFISLGPELMLGLALAFIEQIAGIVDSLINHLLPRLPEIALGMVKALLEAIFVSIREFVKLFAKILVQAVTSIGGLFGKKSDEDKAARRAERQARRDARRNAFDQPFADDEGRGFFEQIFGGRDEEGRGFLQRAFSGLAGNQGGIDFVGRTMASVLHPGEAVLTAPENFARLFGAGAVNATSPTSPFTSAPIAAASRGGGLSTLVVPVSIGGEDVQRVTVRLDQQGRSGAVNRMHRRKNGTHVGLERRR